jgi:hypothetical protein
LRGLPYIADYGYEDVLSLAQSARGEDPYGYRAEFINLVRLANSARPSAAAPRAGVDPGPAFGRHDADPSPPRYKQGLASILMDPSQPSGKRGKIVAGELWGGISVMRRAK